MVLKDFGRITCEARRESFIVHPSYGYAGVDAHTPANDTFGRHWREDPHPEFLIEDLDDLIDALENLRRYYRKTGITTLKKRP